MGNLLIFICGYNNEHNVIVYTVVKDTKSECGQSRHRFQKSQFWSVYTETLPWSSLIELSRDITEISPLWELLPFNLS